MCLTEFGLTMDYTDSMSWSEYRLRLFGWKRKEKRDWYKLRELAWHTTLAPHLDPKKIPKTKERFMPLDGDNVTKVTDKMRERMKEAINQYKKDKNGES